MAPGLIVTSPVTVGVVPETYLPYSNPSATTFAGPLRARVPVVVVASRYVPATSGSNPEKLARVRVAPVVRSRVLVARASWPFAPVVPIRAARVAPALTVTFPPVVIVLMAVAVGSPGRRVAPLRAVTPPATV